MQPGQAGAYFVKMQCLRLHQQALQAGESIEVTVSLDIEPALCIEPNLKSLNSITLSYTYFASKNGQPVATTSAASGQPNL